MKFEWLVYKNHRSDGRPSGIVLCNNHLWKVKFINGLYQAWRMNVSCHFFFSKDIKTVVKKIIKIEYVQSMRIKDLINA